MSVRRAWHAGRIVGTLAVDHAAGTEVAVYGGGEVVRTQIIRRYIAHPLGIRARPFHRTDRPGSNSAGRRLDALGAGRAFHDGRHTHRFFAALHAVAVGRVVADAPADLAKTHGGVLAPVVVHAGPALGDEWDLRSDTCGDGRQQWQRPNNSDHVGQPK